MRSDSGSPIRVVIQNGEYWLCNKGDLAMLEVTVRRLRQRWPDARIGILTSAPNLLRAYLPDTEPISCHQASGWPSTGAIARLSERAGPTVLGPLSVGWLTAGDRWRRYTRRIGWALRRLGIRNPRQRAARRVIPAALRKASLVLAMGGGYFTDVDPEQAFRTLNLLEYAVEQGIPTAMAGQGLGPLEDAVLLEHAARVLPQVDHIALRERLQGPALLDRLGVPPERTTVTGDDAVELAYCERREQLGPDLGVCLRVAGYSPVATPAKETVSRVVRHIAGEVGAGLVPLIISEYRSEDRRSTLPLVEGFANVVSPLGRYVTPREVAARVSQCRVVVTGAYHLGVFALSQGIPVVGLTSSRYYDDKFLGLRGMFGGGLQLVRLDEPDLDKRLVTAVRTAWAQAPEVRGPLRERALAQISASRQSFERIFELVESNPQNVAGPTEQPAGTHQLTCLQAPIQRSAQ
jgi:polysaccharide pyruvyl transferase WcaK-like protein